MKTLKLTQTAFGSARHWLAESLVEGLKPVYLLLRHRRKPWNVTRESLSALPEGTLGRQMADFLNENGLDLMPKAEFHDAQHVLFNMASTEMKQEMSIQFVVIGNGKYSAPYLFSSLVAMALYPEYWEDFYAAYKMGRQAIKFHDIDLEQLLDKPTVELRRLIFLQEAA